jgi:hypothetical protein
MSEADFEYLLRTLAEAQSRATEIAIGVRGRVGVDHRLAELGNSAVSQIESVLKDMRKVAAEEASGRGSEDVRPAKESETTLQKTAAKNTANLHEQAARGADLPSEHWFPAFVNDLLERYQSSGGITFETVECVLRQRKEAFVKDLDTARRMYRSYPDLFPESAPRQQ